MRNALSIGVALLIVMAANASAGTTGQLTGFVFDEQGLPLAAVAVAAASPAQIGGEQLTTTGADGSFVFPRLAPGYYSVRLELVGYAPQQLEEVQVRLDRVTTVRVDLSPTAFTGQIEVAEVTPVVDPVQVSAVQTFTSEYMTETRAQWSSLVTQTAGASNDNFRRVMGSTPQDGGYLLDGMDSTNWYQRFPNLAAANLPFDAIQEVAVHSAGFEAEYGQATGAVVSVITKSGGNLFSGTLDARYTDNHFETAGEHYDPDEQESEDARLDLTLGGPIVRDRLWFFSSYSARSYRETPTGAPTTYLEDQDVFLAKLTWRPGPSWSLAGKYSHAPLAQDNLGSSQFRDADAVSTWHRTPSITTLETLGMLSPDLLWSLRVGRKEWEETGLPRKNDFRSINHLNLVTGRYSGNWSTQWYAETWHNEASSDISWFADAAGSHELKLGVGYGNPRFVDNECLNGSGGSCQAGVEGFQFQDLADDSSAAVPYVMVVERAEGPLEYGGEAVSAFIQDAWRLRPNLTLKAGLRWDRSRYDNETGEIADLSKVQPRIGIAWDLGNDGRTAFRASWGRFMHPGTVIINVYTNENAYPSEFWLSCSTLVASDPEACAAIAEAYGLGYRNDPDGWDPAGWILTPGNVIESEPGRTADNLRAGYSDQWLIGLEREISRRTSVEISYIEKTGKDMFDDTCSGNVPEPTQGAACDYYVTANLPVIRSDYRGLIVRFETRASDQLHLFASWVISESKGSMDFNTGAQADFDFYPYHFVNRYGFLTDHSRHRVKLNGYWMLPYDFTLSFGGWWDSEFRWTPYDQTVAGMPYGVEYVEPRGNRKGNSLHQIDLQIAKGFRIGPTRLVLLGTVINATDSQRENVICGSVTGCDDFELGEGTAWQQPRRYEVGFRVEF